MESIRECYDMPSAPYPSLNSLSRIDLCRAAHMAIALGASLAGLQRITQCIEDALFHRQLEELLTYELCPCPRAEEELQQIWHYPDEPDTLSVVCPGAVAKWRIHILPHLKEFISLHGILPKWLTFSLAALLTFYRSTADKHTYLIGTRTDGTTYEIHDTLSTLTCFQEESQQDTRNYVWHILHSEDMWGENLTLIPGLATAVTKHIHHIDAAGIKPYITYLINAQP